MDKSTLLDKSEVEKFNEDFLTIAFPDWMRSTRESHDFRGFVIDKHTILEHLLDLLIVAYYFGTIYLDKAESFRNIVLSNMDFGRKVRVVRGLDLIDSKIEKLIFQVNDYRIAQAHIKKDDPLREPNKQNREVYQRISTEVHSKLSSKIMLTDSNLKQRVTKIAVQKTNNNE